MARGVAKSAEERIVEIEDKKLEFQAKIDKYKGKIAELDQQIRELNEERRQKELEALLNAIQKSGKTVEDVLSAIGIRTGNESEAAASNQENQ